MNQMDRMDHVYVYVIHHCDNYSEDGLPKCVIANNLKDAYYQAFLNDDTMRWIYDADPRFLNNINKKDETAMKTIEALKDNIISSLMKDGRIMLHKWTDILINKEPMVKHCKN